MKSATLQTVLFLLVAFLLIGGTTGCVSHSSGLPVLQADGSMIMRGKVTKISGQEGVLTIKPPKGDRVVVKVTADTILKDMKSLADLKKNQAVEVVYVIKGEENIVISVKTIASGSC